MGNRAVSENVWPQNALSERLNLEWPIFQAPMGDLTTPALAASVSNAGGLGGLGMWGFTSEEAERRIAGFRQQSGGGLNVNYPLWEHQGDLTESGLPMRENLQALYDARSLGPVPIPNASNGGVTPEHLDVLVKMKPEVLSFHFGVADQDTVEALKSAGIFLISSATTVDEARRLEASGVEAIIAQGTEAGGHRGTFTGTDISMQPGLMALLPQIVDSVKVPVIAAGGIADGRAVAAALMLGASGVQVGTAFLQCEEADVPDNYRAALNDAGDSSTVVTDKVSGRPARFIRNSHLDDLLAIPADPVAFPAQLALTSPLRSDESRDSMALYAGQAAGLSRKMPAGDLVKTLAAETSQRLKTFT